MYHLPELLADLGLLRDDRMGTMDATRRAFDDVLQAIALRRFWARLAWHEIKVRYRGSVIGPFWLTLSTALMIAGLGVLYAQLLEQPPERYVPFLALGILLWNFMTGCVTECAAAFLAAAGTIRQVKLPLLGYILQTVWRNLIVFAHHLVVLVGVTWWFQLPIGWGWLWALAGFIVLLASAFCLGTTLAFICVRFRDMTQILASFFNLAFFLSPILWEAKMLKSGAWLAAFNPFYALIEIVRGPILAQPVAPEVWFLALAFLGLSALVTCVIFVRYRARVVYWI